jgi:hypothetical protein
MDIMLDIETLGTRPQSVVLTVGAVKFDPYQSDVDTDDGLYVRIDVDQQIALGRHVHQDVIDWWGRQAEDVREEALGEHERDSVSSFLKKLNKFLVGADNIWCQGPAFDAVILEDLYRDMEFPTPWNFWQIRDSRTLFKTFGDPRDKKCKRCP